MRKLLNVISELDRIINDPLILAMNRGPLGPEEYKTFWSEVDREIQDNGRVIPLEATERQIQSTLVMTYRSAITNLILEGNSAPNREDIISHVTDAIKNRSR